MFIFDYEFKVEPSGTSGEFEGYASTFGNVDNGGDVVLPGAFAKGLELRGKKGLPNLPLLWQHDMREPIGVVSEATEDSNGLLIKGELLIADDQSARRAYAHLKKGSIGGLSIGYRVNDFERDPKQPNVRLLKEIDLMEVSLVTVPMNERAKVTAIKNWCAGDLPTLPEFEEFLRESGFSKMQATAIASKGLRVLQRREAGATNKTWLNNLAAALRT